MKKKAGKVTSDRLLPNRPPDEVQDLREHVFGEAAKQLDADQIEQPQQKELLAPPEAAARPVAVQNGRLLATYVGLGLERDKDNEMLIHLDFSFPLEEAHDGFIPKKVKEAWLWLKDSGNKAVQIIGIPPVTLDVFLDPKEKKPELHLVGAEFTKAVISLIEEVGKGASKMVTRFSFRLRVERDKDVISFAAWHDGELYWLKMPSTQREIDE